jgi:diguanylate cyclase (GGDEF)-like protein/PAS domain S-box-containing protein
MFLVFVADLQFTTEIYMGMLYLIVIMLAMWLPSTKYIIGLAICSSILTSYGYFNSIYNIDYQAYMNSTGIINLGITLTAIWITTAIAYYIKTISVALHTNESIHNAILVASLDPILTIDKNGIIESASKAIEKTFGWTVAELKGKRFDKLLAPSCRAQYSKLFSVHANIATSHLIGRLQGVTALHRVRRDFPCELSINYVHIPELERPIFTAALRDITARKAAEGRMSWLSTHDDLTKIFNRRYFNEHIDMEWKRAIRSRDWLGMIIVDIDFFKNYNDYLGHQSGDTCLQTIALHMQSVVRRTTDFVARYGGEEFVILLPSTDLRGCEQVAENLQDIINGLNIAHPNSPISHKVTVSIGVAAMIPTLGFTYENLIRLADQALYQAKEGGRNRYCVFEE